MNKYLTIEELKEVFGELKVNNKEYKIKIKDAKEKILAPFYLIKAINPMTRKEVAKVTIIKNDTIIPSMIARKKFLLTKLIQKGVKL